MKIKLIAVNVLLVTVLWGCSTAPKTEESKRVLRSEVDQTISIFKKRDPGIKKYFEDSYGYAVFPEVIKGAFWVGGAGGRGMVYEQGDFVGYSTLSQATLGFSFGGEFFREIIFFADEQSLDEFTSEEFEFSAQATGVILTAGAAAKADYDAGKAVFIIAETGAMIDVSVGGQKFEYVSKELE